MLIRKHSLLPLAVINLEKQTFSICCLLVYIQLVYRLHTSKYIANTGKISKTMKRKYLCRSSKRKQKEARLRNDEKGKRTLDQLNWAKAVSPFESATTNQTIEKVQDDNAVIEPTETTVSSLTPIHENTGGEWAVHYQPADEYSESQLGTNTTNLGNTTAVPGTSTSESSVRVSNDVGSWKSLSASERDSNVILGPQRPPESLLKDSKGRSFPMSIFSRKMPNSETVPRDWLVWSVLSQRLFCFCCCLFTTKSPSVAQSEFSHPQLGCKDHWRKLYDKARAHEKSAAHKSNYLKWRDLIISLKESKGIDSLQQQQFVKEKERWRAIVRSLLEVTLYLAERNLPFRGSSSGVGDPENGLFLGSLELPSGNS